MGQEEKVAVRGAVPLAAPEGVALRVRGLGVEVVLAVEEGVAWWALGEEEGLTPPEAVAAAVREAVRVEAALALRRPVSVAPAGVCVAESPSFQLGDGWEEGVVVGEELALTVSVGSAVAVARSSGVAVAPRP